MFVSEPTPFGQALGSYAGKGARVVAMWAVTIGVAGAVLALGSALLFDQAKAFFTAGEAGSDVAKIELAPLAQRSILYAADGSVLQHLRGEEDRLPVPIDMVPQHVITAVLDAEDERYFDHGPLDLRSMTRALVSNLEAGEISEGGSTITQQLVKTALLNPKQDLNRKLQEASLAIRLERQMSKTEILERYLNTVYFGNSAYGIQAAAERYYETDVDKLTLGQAILLAGLIRNPVGADPYGNPEDARARRDVIIDRMARLGHVAPEEVVTLKEEPLPTPRAQEAFDSSNYFTRHVVDLLQKDPKYLGGTEAERDRLIFRGGISVHATIVPGVQALAEQSIAETLPQDRREFNAALVSVEPASGAVRAAVSGLNFADHKVDLITGLGRQTGSSFKMLTLMAALEHGEIPADLIAGTAPCVIADPNSEDKVWDPSNVEGQGGGVMTLTEATVQSVNCAYARLVKLVGPDKVADVARRMGIKNATLDPPVLAMTLGSREVTPLEMATAYATLANDGEYHEPYFIDRIEDREGNVLFKQSTKGERAVSVANARTVSQTLTQVVQRGTGTAAQVPRWQVAGKTGSTDRNADAWFVGVTPKLATAIWMGDPASNENTMINVGAFPRVYGGTYPAMIFGAYMRQYLQGQTPVDFAPPERVPNQRAPKYLDLPACLMNEVLTPKPCGEVTNSGSRNFGSNNNSSFGNTSSRDSGSTSSGRGSRVTDNTGDDAPVGTAPRGPVATVPQPVIPQQPVVTVPVFPDVTIPRDVFIPPPVYDDDDDTTPTTRRNRG
ncbi:MAG TPA: transglycosylase domain-containing protein [Acidimicrobiales bacterium]|nr:transglycosylase domain-containing protein [Acidimicrobiales bacterium]